MILFLYYDVNVVVIFYIFIFKMILIIFDFIIKVFYKILILGLKNG